jgi:putative hydrolase of the HAD superfamily
MGIAQVTRAILFDFGGTLDSDGKHWVDQFRAAYEMAGYVYPSETFNPAFFESDQKILTDHDLRGKSLRELLGLQTDLIHEILGIAQGAGTAAGKANIVEAFEAETAKLLERNRPILARLAKKYRLGVVSNFCGNLDVICQEYGLAEHLTVIVDSSVVGFEKPDPAIFQVALEKLGVSARETVFVGDNPRRDIEAAKSLGMKTVWLRGSGETPLANPSETDWTIGSLTELEDIL